MNKQFSDKHGFPNKKTSSENSRSFSDDVFAFTQCLEAVVYAQADIAAWFRQGVAGAAAAALAVRIVVFVADVVDGEVDVQIVFAGRFPVGVDVVHAIACAFLGCAFAGGCAAAGLADTGLDEASTPADFEVRVIEVVGETCRPCTADGVGFGVDVVRFKQIVVFGVAVSHAHARCQTAPAVIGTEFVTFVFDVAVVGGLGDAGSVSRTAARA